MSGSALNWGSTHVFRLVLDAAPVPAWICDGRRILYANPALARLLGRSDPEALSGQSTSDVLPPGCYTDFRVNADRLLAGEPVPRWEHELKLANGGAVSVEAASTLVQYHESRAILAFFQDITEQRRVEAALRGAELRYRRIVEGQVVGVFEFTSAGIQDANDVFLRLLRRTPADLREGRLSWLAISPPEDDALDREKLAHLLATGECQPFEKEFLRADGVRVPALMGASLVEGGPSWRAVALVIDLTDRRQLQEIQQEKLRLEAVGVLAAGMAHNLNNILTGVIGNASLLADGNTVPAGSRAGHLAIEILQAGERAAALTARLLAYSGRGRFVTRHLNLCEIAEQELARVTADLPPHLRITTDLDGNLPPVLGDTGQFTQLVRALFDNAIEAIGDREGGMINVSTRLEWLEDRGVLSRLGEPLPSGAYCVLEVRDNGEGMDTNTLAHAFDPFFSTKFPGRGLGLAAVAGIVRAAHGAVRVSSSPGLGTVFQVYLPAAEQH